MPELNSNGIKIFYRTNQLRPGRVSLVFVHGLSGSSSAWLKYEKHFSAQYNIIVFDLRGHGCSDKPREHKDYALANFAKDLDNLIISLQLERAILIGHSFGTLIILEYLVRQAKNILGVVLLSPNFTIKQRKKAWILRPFFELYHLSDLVQHSFSKHTQLDYSRFVPARDWDLRRMYADVKNTTLSVYLHCLKQSYNFERVEFLAKIQQPILILHGQKDSIFPAANSQKLAKILPHCQLILLPKANHILVLNDAREIISVLDDFLLQYK